MSDVPNRPEDPPPPPLGNSATAIHTIPDGTMCPACDLTVVQGQSAVITDVGNVVHAYCWERNR